MQPTADAHPPLAFGHAALARRLVDELQASLRPGAGSSTEPALVIGVFGEWGAGKSRLLQEVAAALDRGDGKQVLNVVVPFNAWRYEREEHLLVPLLRVAQQCLRKALDESLDERLRHNERLSDRVLLLGELAHTVYQHGGRELLQTTLASQGVVLKLPDLKVEAGQTKPSVWRRWSEHSKALKHARRLDLPGDQLHSLYYDFLEHLKAVTGRNPSALALHRERLKHGGAGWWPETKYWVRTKWAWLMTGESPKETDFRLNLVFLVDDLDRCLPDKAVEVLEAVKLFLEVEGCAFVLALDEEVVERGIAHRYRDYALQGREGMTPITGAEYLEKLVHLPVRLPRPTGAAARDFLAGRWPDWFADASYQANDLATLVAAITPGVPRKLHRMTSLLALAESLGAGDAKTPRRREWLAIVCALQLFAPQLYRYLRLHGAQYLITLVQWRTDALFRDVTGLRQALQMQVRGVDSPLRLQHQLVLQRLPDLCEAVMHNRSGFDLLELLARVADLHEKAALTGAQLGALMVFAEVDAAVEQPAMTSPIATVTPLGAHPWEAMGSPEVSETPTAGVVVVEPQVAVAAPTSAPQRAHLENERALLEAVESGDLELVRVALSREGVALRDRVLPWDFLGESSLIAQVGGWIERGAPADTTQFLLQELRPHLSQEAAWDLLHQFGAPVQRVLKRPDWAHDVRSGSDFALLAPPLIANVDAWLSSRMATTPSDWVIPRGWECSTWTWRASGLGPEITFGADRYYGVYALLKPSTRSTVAQRLRWIPAGKFAMGSNGSSEEDEGGLRTVSLSRGFWIADTVCSQAFWAVVAAAAVHQETEMPAVNASAAEIELFLEQLGRWLPGCEVQLPSEAEWEAACRAGTRTAFTFGDTPVQTQINADSRGPLQVAALQPNAWGLYQMHGNVAELCRDLLSPGQRGLDVWGDPEGPPGAKTGLHALRGGSFRTAIESTRSAAVDRIARDERRDDVGFRFIVRARASEDQPPA